MPVFHPHEFDIRFKNAYKYANTIVNRFTKDEESAKDLLQSFSEKCYSNKEKYYPLIIYKRTVFLILKGIHSNNLRKKRPQTFSELNLNDHPGPIHQNSNQFLNTPNYDQISEDYIDSILYSSIQHNGRKGSVHTWKEQVNILKDFKKSKLSQRDFCRKKNISTATLYKLLKEGPKKLATPKSISYFKLHHLKGWSIEQIANNYNVSKHSVSQNIYKAKQVIKKHYQKRSFYSY